MQILALRQDNKIRKTNEIRNPKLRGRIRPTNKLRKGVDVTEGGLLRDIYLIFFPEAPGVVFSVR